MAINDTTSGSHSASRHGARLRLAGVIVLVFGLAGAGVVYWVGTRSPDASDDLSMQGYDRAQMRQMGMLYGKSGLLIEEWTNDLKQPGTQAILIAVVSLLVAAGCFYFARLSDYNDETPAGTDAQHGG